MLNNLALAPTVQGNAERAEVLLKQAMARGSHEARVGHNLALLPSLQGKDEEAKGLRARQLPADRVAANAITCSGWSEQSGSLTRVAEIKPEA